MPKRYEAIRDKLKSQGLSESAAKTRVSKIFNTSRKPGEAAVTGKHKKGA